MTTYEQALQEVRHEVTRAVGLFPKDFSGAHEGYAVILEEVDELWDEVKKNARFRSDDALRAEAKQIAAMAVRFMAELTKPPVEVVETVYTLEITD